MPTLKCQSRGETEDRGSMYDGCLWKPGVWLWRFPCVYHSPGWTPNPGILEPSANSQEPSLRQRPTSCCQPSGKRWQPSHTPFWFSMWFPWLCRVCTKLSVLSTIISTPTSYWIWALKPSSPPTNKRLPGKKSALSLPTEQASTHDQNSTPTTGDHSHGAWERFIEPPSSASFSPHAVKYTHTCIFPRQCLSLQKAPSSVTSHG